MGYTEGQLGHLAKHDSIDASLAQKIDSATAGDQVDHFGTARVGTSLNYKVGTASAPTSGGGPVIKISQTEKITDLAAQMSGNPADNEANAALHVSALSLPGSFGQVNAILATAKGAPTGTDVCALAAWGRVTGGVGAGFGAYLEGRRDTATSRAMGTEIRVQNEGGADGTLSPNGSSDTLGLWISTAATGGYKTSAGVSLGSADASKFIAGYHVTANSVASDSFRDESGSATTLKSVGNHQFGLDFSGATFSGSAVFLPPTTASTGGINFGNDVFFFRNAVGAVRLVGNVSVSGAITTDLSTGWITPTLGNSWVALNTTDSTAQYRRMADGTVRLRGFVKSGTTGTAIFTLPAGFRPSVAREVALNIGGSGFAEIDIMADGTVKVAQYVSGGSNTAVALFGISFTTD
ncbi:hypothetical protein E3T46_07605 [Cryobacterium sp. Hh11]|uniref:hypothetical protein n=1 Tax=Cryobacterium sp. Hh11 TaxID=2555868 RepID=UPI00106B7357|nr:hypothetical protein [Cryobacterium sp. Hh11]TFD51945.1 hypothetical protein E3T46_07605 [Cryobacterium sp. Hh11]